MSRRHFLHLATAALAGVLLSACAPTDTESTPMDADEIFSAAGLTTPRLDTSVTDAPLQGDEPWGRVVTFAGSSAEVEARVEENFPSGIESNAYRDDMAVALERLGAGVQKEGDRIAGGVEGSFVILVVVGQGETPEVHVAVRRPVR